MPAEIGRYSRKVLCIQTLTVCDYSNLTIITHPMIMNIHALGSSKSNRYKSIRARNIIPPNLVHPEWEAGPRRVSLCSQPFVVSCGDEVH